VLILFVSFSISVNTFVNISYINIIFYIIFHLTFIYILFYHYNYLFYLLGLVYGVLFDIFLLNSIGSHLICFIILISIYLFFKKFLILLSSFQVSLTIFLTLNTLIYSEILISFLMHGLIFTTSYLLNYFIISIIIFIPSLFVLNKIDF